MKTLNDAIGCWTNSDNSLAHMAMNIHAAAAKCRGITKKNMAPEVLLEELSLLKRRLESMMEITEGAIKRCKEIIDTEELGQDLNRRK